MSHDVERESLEVDVLYIGAGPATLASALHLTNRVEDMQVDITDSATELVDFFMKEGRVDPK